ncbi:MAG: hypothetical protein NTX92_07490 [Euryarchaeota archaeon]|nr:hypothetical protein [Euryarchaeota archaeon]
MQRIRCKQRKKKTNPVLPVILVTLFLMLIDGSVLSALRAPYLIELSDNTLRYTFFFDEPVLTEVVVNNQTFTTIDMNNCYSYAQPGFPTLPIYRALLLIPEGHSVENIQGTFQNHQRLPYNFLMKPILPEQDFIRIGMDDPQPFVMNDTVYSASTPVFEKIFENGGIGYCRGYEILTIYLYPLQYVPGTGVLTYFPEMTITLQLHESEQQPLREELTLLRYSQTDEDVVRELVTNPAILSTYDAQDMNVLDGATETVQKDTVLVGPGAAGLLDGGYTEGLCNPAQQYQYVIITSQSLKDVTGYQYNWSSLITHRRTFSGLNGTIVTVQEIDACQDYWNVTPLFNDSPAHIREFCKDAYLDWDTEYILLGGDWDATVDHQIVPYRLFTDKEETETYNTMACDKYYSHLDGTWYYEPQGIWGGGRNSGVNDYYAELYIGRIATYNASMVSNAIQKIIWYDLYAPEGWLSQVSFLGGNLGWTVTSKQYMEELRLGNDTYRTFIGFEEWNDAYPETPLDTSECIYHADVGSNYRTYFSNSIEDDNASIINHLDHSDWNSPFGLTNWQYQYNTKPFFGYSQGCLAGRFHAGDAGSEQLMCRYPERHAFAAVLNTGYGYASSTSSNGPSQYIQCYFYDYFFNNQSNDRNNWQLGKAQAYAHEKMSARIELSSHAWCYAWYSAHLFADPAQILRITNSDTEAITIHNETPGNESTIVPINTTALTVSIQQSQGRLLNYSIQTVPDIGNITENNITSGTKSCAISGLTSSTTYTWFVAVSDGYNWANCSFWFSTENPDTIPPVISSILYRVSNPIDLQPGLGWENISCNVTDNSYVYNVTIHMSNPDNSTRYITMNRKINTNIYYYNTTFSTYGNFSFYIWANDTNNNQVYSNISGFLIPPNWDINNDRICSMEDLLLASDQYGKNGSPGWIREDIDNNGTVQVFDFVLLSNQYTSSW